MTKSSVLIAIIEAAGQVTASAVQGRAFNTVGDGAAVIFAKAIRAGIEAVAGEMGDDDGGE